MFGKGHYSFSAMYKRNNFTVNGIESGHNLQGI